MTKHRMTTKIRMSEALIPNFSDNPPQTPSNTFLLLDRYKEFKFFLLSYIAMISEKERLFIQLLYVYPSINNRKS